MMVLLPLCTFHHKSEDFVFATEVNTISQPFQNYIKNTRNFKKSSGFSILNYYRVQIELFIIQAYD